MSFQPTLTADPVPMSVIERLPETSVPVSCLRAGFQLRQGGTDAAHVRLLADAAEAAPLPPVLVHRDSGRVIDGMHRVQAARQRGERAVCARIIECTEAEALVLAVRLNTRHGLPLSRTDRIGGARRILATHPDWSDRAIAHIAGLSGKTIASLRTVSAGAPAAGPRVGRDGRRRPVRAGEGRRRATEYITAHPGASLRQVARETGVSLGTAHGARERLRGSTGPGPAGSGPAGSGLLSAPAVLVRHDGRGRGVMWAAISAKLAGDPALRYTEGGRAFLRWMTGHCDQADDWRAVIDAIPAYWLADVSRVALGMSEEWRQLAAQLDSKIEQLVAAS